MARRRAKASLTDIAQTAIPADVERATSARTYATAEVTL
jgi:hypothetical protein